MELMSAISAEKRALNSPPEPLSIIVDCDVHPVIADASLLRPHLSKRAQRRAFGNLDRPPAINARPVANRSNHPSTPLRLDAAPPAGGPPGSDPAYALEQWIDPYGISAALLIPVQAGLVVSWGDETAGAELLASMNSVLIERWVQFDSRYRLVIAVSPYDIPAAVAEVERLARVPGVAGIIIPYAAVEFGRSQYFPLYEAAVAHDLPLVLHQTGAEGHSQMSSRIAGGVPTTWAERHTQLFQPGQAILASMIFGGVFDRFPALKVVLVEFGWSWLPMTQRRMDKAWQEGDGKLAGLSKPPSAYIRENVRFSTQPFDEPGNRQDLNQLLETFDAEQVLVFSSDYPHYDNDDPRYLLKTRIPERLRSTVAWRNAVDTFGARLGLSL
jgi:uncharacterized protein